MTDPRLVPVDITISNYGSTMDVNLDLSGSSLEIPLTPSSCYSSDNSSYLETSIDANMLSIPRINEDFHRRRSASPQQKQRLRDRRLVRQKSCEYESPPGMENTDTMHLQCPHENKPVSKSHPMLNKNIYDGDVANKVDKSPHPIIRLKCLHRSQSSGSEKLPTRECRSRPVVKRSSTIHSPRHPLSRQSSECRHQLSRQSSGCTHHSSRQSSGCMHHPLSRQSSGCTHPLSRQSSGCTHPLSRQSSDCSHQWSTPSEGGNSLMPPSIIVNTPNVQRKCYDQENVLIPVNNSTLGDTSRCSANSSQKSPTIDPSVLQPSPSFSDRSSHSKEQMKLMQRSSTCDSESCDFSGSDWAADELACDEEVRMITGDGTDQDTDSEITEENQVTLPLIRVPSETDESSHNDGSDSPRTVAYSTETLVNTDQTSRKNSDESFKNSDIRSLLDEKDEDDESVPFLATNCQNGEENRSEFSGAHCTETSTVAINIESPLDESKDDTSSVFLSISPADDSTTRIRHRSRSSNHSGSNC